MDAQLEKLRAYATEHALRVFGEYVDPGFQGDTEDRPGLRRLLGDAREQKFAAVLVYRFDRLCRDVRLFLNTEHEFRRHGVRLVSVTEAIDDTHEGRLQLLIKGSFAEYEKAVIRERANLGRMRAAHDGKWMGGPPPYGYDLDRERSRLVVNREEAQWVKKFFGWLVHEHLTLAKLQRRVNDLGVPTKWGSLSRTAERPVNRKGWWMKRTLGRILTRELYIGTFYYRKIAKPRAVKRSKATVRAEDEWIPITVPPVIDGRLFRLAQRQLRRNSELSPRRTGRPYLLQRLIECGACGRAWIACRNNFDRPYYLCSGRRRSATSERCEQPSVSAAKLEPVVWDAVVDLLRNPDLVLAKTRQRLAGQDDLERKEHELQVLADQVQGALQEDERLIRAYKEGVIGLEALKREREDTAARIHRLSRQHELLASELSGWLAKDAQLAAVAALSRKFRHTLREMPYERRCEIVRHVVERVIIREGETEIRTILPAPQLKTIQGQGVGIRDQRGVDVPANQPGYLGTFVPLDPTDVIRITIFADLPPTHPSSPTHRSRVAA